MRALSLKQASHCERAKHKTCRCRCGGALHGKMRSRAPGDDRYFYERLPADDPHHVRTEEEKKRMRRIRYSEKKADSSGQFSLFPGG